MFYKELEQLEHKSAISELRERADIDWIEIRNARYKLEDQENRSRRRNLQVRGLPEEVKDKDLGDVLRELFNLALKWDLTLPMQSIKSRGPIMSIGMCQGIQ